MAVNTRLKRQSATCMVVPSMVSGVYPDTAGVVQAERQGVAWAYSGILATLLTITDISIDYFISIDIAIKTISINTAILAIPVNIAMKTITVDDTETTITI